MQTYYKTLIAEILDHPNYYGDAYDPRHIEAYMRLEHSTLDALTRDRFNEEVSIAVECINVDGVSNAESLALSFGL